MLSPRDVTVSGRHTQQVRNAESGDVTAGNDGSGGKRRAAFPLQQIFSSWDREHEGARERSFTAAESGIE
ncbi:hypothetical protein Q5P01_008610 [Channa striata]|uniref:Uncharacterized protein n=1 Tax=Channa striata TaxID=64152 RepID=A0AA88SRS8_CHASR|nr:hypothetical protein Q5P01_008610 [Channa striata]